MEGPLRQLAGRRRREALDTLVRELATFAPEGLARLRDDLATGRVVRRSWDGCVLSYRHGGPGSSSRDARGRPRNPFTVAWDAGVITDEEVLEALGQELGRRPGAKATPWTAAGRAGPTPAWPLSHARQSLRRSSDRRPMPRPSAGPGDATPEAIPTRPARPPAPPPPLAPGPRNGGPVEGGP